MVVAHDIRFDSPFKLPGIRIRVEIDVLVFDAPPKPLDNHVVEPAAFAIHADGNPQFPKLADPVGGCELAALVSVEDLRHRAGCGHSLVQGAQAEVRIERV